MQLAMAAMSQFGGGISAPISGGMPMPMPVRPMAPYSSPAPVSNGWRPSMQATTLASTTCLLRSGRIGRDQAIQFINTPCNARTTPYLALHSHGITTSANRGSIKIDL